VLAKPFPVTTERAQGCAERLSDCGSNNRSGNFWQIVLQKSKVAGPRIFRENMNREEVADSYRFNRVTNVACEFNVRR